MHITYDYEYFSRCNVFVNAIVTTSTYSFRYYTVLSLRLDFFQDMSSVFCIFRIAHMCTCDWIHMTYRETEFPRAMSPVSEPNTYEGRL